MYEKQSHRVFLFNRVLFIGEYSMASIFNQQRPMVLALVLLLVAFAGMCQGEILPEARELVDRYREAITCWNQRVSIQIHSQIDETPVNPDHPSLAHQRLNLIHRRDGNRAEWLGSKSFFEDDKAEVSTSSRKFAVIANGRHIVVADDAWTPDERYRGTIRRRNYGKILRSASDDFYYGGFLDGLFLGLRKTANMAELLSQSDMLRVIGKEDINETVCYIVEAETEEARFRVWIAPEKGYNMLKATIDSSIAPGSIVIDSIEVQKINGIFVPVAGRFVETFKVKDGVKTVHAKVKRSQIDLNPDFEALGAFRLALPDGSRIDDRDSGISYQVFGGEMVPNVDEAVIEQIDKMTEEIMAEGKVPPGLATVRKPEAAPNEPATTSDTHLKTQVDTVKTQPEVVAEAYSLTIVLVILIVLLIIGVIGWLVFRRIKT